MFKDARLFAKVCVLLLHQIQGNTLVFLLGNKIMRTGDAVARNHDLLARNLLASLPRLQTTRFSIPSTKYENFKRELSTFYSWWVEHKSNTSFVSKRMIQVFGKIWHQKYDKCIVTLLGLVYRWFTIVFKLPQYSTIHIINSLSTQNSIRYVNH